MTHIAVTGAGGAIGSRVVSGLAAAGVSRVTALVRDVCRVPHLDDVTAAQADYDDLAALTHGMTGADVLVFIGSDGVADRMLVHHRNILDAARGSGVERIVLLSSQDASPTSPFCYAHTYARTEEWARTACPEVSVIRAGLYTEFFGRFILDALGWGRLELPMAGAAVAPIARADVAAALVAAALADEPPTTATITGPQALDLDGLARVASTLAGSPVKARDCSMADFRHSLVADDLEPWWAYAFTSMFESIGHGAFGEVTEDLSTLTGREPQPFGATLSGRSNSSAS